MKKILLFGSGRSTFNLIKYLDDASAAFNAEITVLDRNAEEIGKIHKVERTKFINEDLSDSDIRKKYISDADIVVSMLPARFHHSVAKDCLELKTRMATASYLTEEMESLDSEAKAAGITILNEVGLDPGIDHMSALNVIHRLQADGNSVTGFESFTGGLLAPESEQDNPWQYKFTWNPRNVVLAGAAGAVKFIDNGMYKYIPYHRLFRRTEIIDLGDYGKFEGYANRDSLKYRSLYGLDDVGTMFRGTLRRPGFCKAWNIFVQLGMTDDSYQLDNVDQMTNRSFVNTFLKYHPTDSVEIKLMQYLKLYQDDVDILEKLEWLDLFKEEPIGLKEGSPAKILQHILEKKWSLADYERDMIVMWHKFTFEKNGVEGEIHSSMVVEGDDQNETAMSKTVGLPLAIAVEMLITGAYDKKGVALPMEKDLYGPILSKLEQLGIRFNETQIR